MNKLLLAFTTISLMVACTKTPKQKSKLTDGKAKDKIPQKRLYRLISANGKRTDWMVFVITPDMMWKNIAVLLK